MVAQREVKNAVISPTKVPVTTTCRQVSVGFASAEEPIAATRTTSNT